MTKSRVFTSTWTLLPVMDPVEAARFTAGEGFAGMEIQCDRQHLLDEARRRAVEAIAEWADTAAEADLVIPIENEGHVHHTVAPTATLVREMVEATGCDNVKVNLDTGHAFINGGLEEEFTVLKDHIVHVHLNDGRTPGVSEYLPLGEGMVDLAPLAPFMNAFDGALALEIYAPDRPVEATLESRDRLIEILASA